MEFSPADNGRLAGSWQLQERGQDFAVGTDVEYALAQNNGVDPFMIYPRKAQALRFKVNGQVIFAKEVLHPGFEGSHYIEGAISATESRIPEFVEMSLAEEGLT
ncbi:HK97 gp10 family phage protein [Gracilibacillus sp. D59]